MLHFAKLLVVFCVQLKRVSVKLFLCVALAPWSSHAGVGAKEHNVPVLLFNIAVENTKHMVRALG